MRRISFMLLWLISPVTNTQASPIISLASLPASVVPGATNSFEIRLAGAVDLGAYNIDLVLESSAGTSGVDFFFDAGLTEPASIKYVFSSSANFFDATNIDSPDRHRITLTDFDLAGTNTVADVNDHVATVYFQTANDFQGTLQLSVDATSLILDTTDITPTPIAGFDVLQTDVANMTPIEISVIPEPSTILLGMLTLCGSWSLFVRAGTTRG